MVKKQITIPVPEFSDLARFMPRPHRLNLFGWALILGTFPIWLVYWPVAALITVITVAKLALASGMSTEAEVQERERRAYLQGRADLAREVRERREAMMARAQATPPVEAPQASEERVHSDYVNGQVRTAMIACAVSCVGSFPVWLAAIGGVL